MSVAVRRTVLAAGLFALVALAAMLSSSSFVGSASARPSLDCTSLTGKDKYKCLQNRCDSRGAQSLPCKQLEQQIGQGEGKKPADECPSGQTPGTVNGKSKCLKAGQKCKKKYKTDYAASGFRCKGKTNKRTGKKVYKLKASKG